MKFNDLRGFLHKLEARGELQRIHREIDPCLGAVYAFEEIGQAHYDMEQGKSVNGNRVALVGAEKPGLGRR